MRSVALHREGSSHKEGHETVQLPNGIDTVDESEPLVTLQPPTPNSPNVLPKPPRTYQAGNSPATVPKQRDRRRSEGGDDNKASGDKANKAHPQQPLKVQSPFINTEAAWRNQKAVSKAHNPQNVGASTMPLQQNVFSVFEDSTARPTEIEIKLLEEANARNNNNEHQHQQQRQQQQQQQRPQYEFRRNNTLRLSGPTNYPILMSSFVPPATSSGVGVTPSPTPDNRTSQMNFMKPEK